MDEKLLSSEVSEKGVWTILSLQGRLDRVTSTEVGEQAEELLASSTKLAVEMTGLEYLSSAGLRIILRLAKKAKAAKKVFAICGAEGFVKEVLDLLAETGFPPENLCLEITERCRILDVKLLRNTFGTLRSCGIRVALDDFGTGFSSLGILRELEVDTVKIDRDYVKNIVHSKADQSTVQFIASLAGSFGAKLCVEGVETAEMRNHLLRYQVDSLQGYYYSKPIPIAEFKEKYLA